jgi:hypothetical protein
MKYKLAWVLLPAALLLAGCGERYRYPCQDPENWDQKVCQKPFCSANGTCPEDLTHYEKQGAPKPPAPTPERPANGGAGKC